MKEILINAKNKIKEIYQVQSKKIKDIYLEESPKVKGFLKEQYEKIKNIDLKKIKEIDIKEVFTEKINYLKEVDYKDLTKRLFKFPTVIFTMSVIFFIAGFTFIEYQLNEKKHYQQVLEIKAGDRILPILTELYPEKKNYFKGYLKLKNGGKNIKAGYYLLNGDYSVRTLVNLLEEGRDKLFRFTIQEGLTVKEVVAKLEKENRANGEKFMNSLKEIDFPYPTPDGNFEGYFYPDTYYIPENADEKTIAKIFLREFMEKFPPENYPDKEDFYKKLVLASIIEREAVLADEKPRISSVFHNRLKIDMPLASDATVNYLYNYGKRRMYYKDLEIESPYNTYKNKGLPPGPIGNPDKKSIDAAFNPEETPYYFFVACGGGAHHFTKTYQEHLNFQRENLMNGEKK